MRSTPSARSYPVKQQSHPHSIYSSHLFSLRLRSRSQSDTTCLAIQHTQAMVLNDWVAFFRGICIRVWNKPASTEGPCIYPPIYTLPTFPIVTGKPSVSRHPYSPYPYAQSDLLIANALENQAPSCTVCERSSLEYIAHPTLVGETTAGIDVKMWESLGWGGGIVDQSPECIFQAVSSWRGCK